MKSLSALFLLPALAMATGLRAQQAGQPERVIRVDYKKTQGAFGHAWETCVGAGRAAEGLRADWQQQLLVAKKEIGFQYIRFHGLLCDEMHVYTEDKAGNPQYNWQYVDKLYDYLLSIGVRPFVELGFMPPDLASGTKTVFWWKGNVTPPKSYDKWSDLIKALVQHWEDRYGREEVARWYFEVWNEPDLHGFFDGTMEEYFKLYKTTAAAVKAISPLYRVGGPATSGSKWIHEMLQFCADNKVPLDFVSTHSYNTKTVFDEFGTRRRTLLAPGYLSGSVQTSRRIIDSTAYKGLPLHYTEFNVSPSSRDPLHDGYQNAPFILNTLKNTEHAAASMSYWTFTDIFEEAGPAMTSFHGGFGLINLQGIRKPTFFAYKFLHEMGATELRNTDSCSWVCKDKSGVQALFWNLSLPANEKGYFNDTIFRKNAPPKEAGFVTLRVGQVPNGRYRVLVYRTGYHHNDPYSAYLDMGAPANISRRQEAALKAIAAGKPDSEQELSIANGEYSGRFAVRENDVYFIKLIKL